MTMNYASRVWMYSGFLLSASLIFGISLFSAMKCEWTNGEIIGVFGLIGVIFLVILGCWIYSLIMYFKFEYRKDREYRAHHEIIVPNQSSVWDNSMVTESYL